MEFNSSDINKKSFTSHYADKTYYFLGFIIWPFGITLAAIRHFDKEWSRNIFWLFCIFFGYTFYLAEDIGDSADSIRYAQLLGEYAQSRMSINELASSLYNASAGYVDVAQALITYLVSVFTDSTAILFAVFGGIFGYFYSRNLFYLLSRIGGRNIFLTIIYVLNFTLINPIWNINAFRMWTAAHIFLYGVLPYLLEGDKKKLLWAVSAVFFHFSFIFAVAILGIYLITKNRTAVYLGLFIITSFIKEIDLYSIQSSLAFLPDVFQTRVNSYTNLDYAEIVNATSLQNNWYIRYSFKALGWASYAIVLAVFFFGRRNNEGYKRLKPLLSFALLFYSAANISSLVPSGDRFLIVANSIIFAFFILYLSMNKVKFHNAVFAIAVPLVLLYSIVAIRTGMDYYSLVTLLGNPIFAIFDTSPEPLITGIKNLI